MTERIFAVARKEMIQLKRDPRSLILAFGLPVIMVLIFGYAISFDVNDIRLAVLDQDRSRESREVIDAFRATEMFHNLGAVAGPLEAQHLLEEGRAQIVIVFREGFAEGGLGTPAALGH